MNETAAAAHVRRNSPMASHRAAFVTVLFVFSLAASGALGPLVHRAGALMVVGDVRSEAPDVPLPLGSAIAVHLGNTRSCVAGSAADGVVFHRCIPSWVALSNDDDHGALLVGEAAKIRAAADPRAAVFGFKRLLGKRFRHADVQRAGQNVPYAIVNNEGRTGIQLEKTTKDGGRLAKVFDVEDVAAMVVGELKAQAEAHLGRKVHSAVVTVPYYFDDASRRAAMDAATFAGLETVRILDEPIAAAVSGGLHEKLRHGSTVLVLHVGGGATEATVLVYEDGVFEAIGAWRDLHLGGDDFDRIITDHFTKVMIQRNHGTAADDNPAALRSRLRTECERAKKELSDRNVTHVSVDSLSLSALLTRAEFEELSYDLLRRVAAVVEMAVAGSEVAVVDEIVLLGGSSRIPMIRKLVANYSRSSSVADHAVVHGGALLGHPTAELLITGRTWMQSYLSKMQI